MPIALNDIIQLSFKGSFVSQRVMLVLNYRCSVAPAGQTTLDQLGALIQSALPPAVGSVGEFYLDCLGTNYTMEEARAQIISPTRSAFVSETVSLAGTSAGPATTTNIAAVVTMRTPFAGRKEVSNSHVGPLPAESLTGATYNAALRAALISFAESRRADITTTDGGVYAPGIYHKNGDGPGQKFSPIISYVVQTYTRTMRRRTVGRGE